MYFLKISHRCFHWSSVSRFHASSWTHARGWRLLHGHLQYDRQCRWVKLTSRAVMKQQLLFRAGQKQSIAERKAQKSYGHNQSSADKEACDPVFPPIRPGKADYSIPGLSLSLSSSFHCGRRTRSVIFRDVRPCYLTRSFQRLWTVGHYCNCVTSLFTSHIWLEIFTVACYCNIVYFSCK